MYRKNEWDNSGARAPELEESVSQSKRARDERRNEWDGCAVRAAQSGENRCRRLLCLDETPYIHKLQGQRRTASALYDD